MSRRLSAQDAESKRDLDMALKQIVRKLLTYEPRKIILFGSHAYGQPDADSDLDLLVVTDVALPLSERYLGVRRTIGPLDFPLDVFTMTHQEFEETREVIGGLAYAPAKYGKILYEKP
jgi:predicted nucleotidyltransferase